MKTFWIRTLSATVYAALFLGSILSGHLVGETWGTIILLAFSLFVTIGCTFEYYRIAEKQNAKPNKVLGYIMSINLVVVLGLNGLIPLPGWVVAILLTSVVLSIPIALGAQLWRKSDMPFADVLHTLLPVAYIAFPLSTMASLHYDYNVLIMCIIMVWVNDSFAYMGGSLVGKHKMWPRHSPGKTWEGTIIGILATVATGIFVGPLFSTYFGRFDWIVIAFVCSIIGTLGDLSESMLKRSVGLKDSGNIMPGHGGFLDRFDSLLFILPVVWVYCMIIY